VDARGSAGVAASCDVDSLPEVLVGPDALAELDVDRLRVLLAASGAPLKAFLLDQKRVAGLGNIYVCEALFRARLHPARRRVVLRAAPTQLLAWHPGRAQDALANRGTTMPRLRRL